MISDHTLCMFYIINITKHFKPSIQHALYYVLQNPVLNKCEIAVIDDRLSKDFVRFIMPKKEYNFRNLLKLTAL